MADDVFCDLLVIDDIYPSSFSPFRTIEYNHYLSFFNSAVLSLEGWNLWIDNTAFADNKCNQEIAAGTDLRIYDFQTKYDMGARLAYITFLGNAYPLLPYLEERNLPFILQLYPGGGFAIDESDVDDKLRKVLNNDLCKKVIVTQTVTRDYILQEKIGCPEDKIEFIFGGVFDSNVDFEFSRDKKIYGRDKPTIDLCFVAHKYADDLVSKGYDYFIALAHQLAPRFNDLRFHVVGSYEPSDVDVSMLGERITFYGRQPSSFFEDFYPRMDGIVSVNRPFVLAPGAFDGFPTGACLEAGFRGVANFINDPLDMNTAFIDGRDIIILEDDLKNDVNRIALLLEDPTRLSELGRASCQSFRRIMNVDQQLWKRTRLIAAELNRHEGLVINRAATSPTIAVSPLAERVRVSEAVSAERLVEIERLVGVVNDFQQEIARLVGVVHDMEERLRDGHSHTSEIDALRLHLEIADSISAERITEIDRLVGVVNDFQQEISRLIGVVHHLEEKLRQSYGHVAVLDGKNQRQLARSRIIFRGIKVLKNLARRIFGARLYSVAKHSVFRRGMHK